MESREYFRNFDGGGGGEGFVIGEDDWRLWWYLIASGLCLDEECEAEAESIIAHNAASSRSLSSAITGYVIGDDI